MKIIHTKHSGEQCEASIEEAVESNLNGADYDRGSLETAQATADNVKAAFAKLIATLHAAELLSDAELQGFMNEYRYKVRS